VVDWRSYRALITGGASGIGLATAQALSGRGARVLVVDRDRERLKSVADLGGVETHEADVSTEEAFEALARRLQAEGVPLDLLYLNAGIAIGVRDISQVTTDQVHAIVGANFLQSVWGIKHLMRLIRRPGGQVLVTASLAGIVPFPPDPIYTATKHAVVGLVRSLGPLFSENGLRINAICPGLVDTPLLGQEAREALARLNFPLIAPSQVAEAVLYAIEGDFCGECVVCQVGRDPELYEFRGVPGPRGEGVEGRRPEI
jgi:NAD(P)-dependent dehydrogenase (short-subunit alcohol dehydrogenase family)